MIIHDKVLPAKLFTELRDTYTSVPYKFGWHSNKAQPAGRLFHYAPYQEQSWEYRVDVVHRLAEHPLLVEAWNALKERGVFCADAVLLRCYLNLQVFGQESALHRDSWEWHEDDKTAVIYLVPDDWDSTWGGGTLIYENHDEVFTGVVPKANRAAVFPARLPHRAEPLSKRCLTSRTVLVFKACDTSAHSAYDELAAKYEWNLHKVGGIQLSEHMYGTNYVLRMIAEKVPILPALVAASTCYLAYGLKDVAMPKIADRADVRAVIGDEAEELVYQLSRLTRDEARATEPFSHIIKASDALVPQKDVEA